MPTGVNDAPVLVRLAALGAALACLATACGAAGGGARGGGSTVEIEWLAPPADGDEARAVAPRPPVRPTTDELGDGGAASETVAGAVRLLGLEVDDQVFLRHALAGALSTPAALREVALPAVGDVARRDGVTAVVERVDGLSIHLVGLRGGRVERWVEAARGLRFARP